MSRADSNAASECGAKSGRCAGHKRDFAVQLKCVKGSFSTCEAAPEFDNVCLFSGAGSRVANYQPANNSDHSATQRSQHHVLEQVRTGYS